MDQEENGQNAGLRRYGASEFIDVHVSILEGRSCVYKSADTNCNDTLIGRTLSLRNISSISINIEVGGITGLTRTRICFTHIVAGKIMTIVAMHTQYFNPNGQP